MTQQFRPLQAEISTNNLRHNYKLLKKMAGERVFFCPMIKAYAYGHDDVVVAKTLADEGCEAFGVALLEEGIRLRENKIAAKTILVFHPLLEARAAEQLIEFHLTPVLSSWDEIEILEGVTKRPHGVHIKFNTGMNRLGFETSDAEKLKSYFSKKGNLRLDGVCTHFFNSEDWLGDGHTALQLEKFLQIEKLFGGADVATAGISFHALNSSAIAANFCSSKPLALGARPGIALYGVKPPVENLSGAQKEKYDALTFEPVMRVLSKIILTHNLKRGERVSYGGHFVAENDTIIGVVPVGYADGFFRHFSSKGVMVCEGARCPVAGTVCMDFTMLDLSRLASAEKNAKKNWIGTPVTILGDGLAAEELAQIIGTNAYEILTNVSRRVPRIFV